MVLEAKLMQSSGDAEFDAQALEGIIGRSVPTPNKRMWSEWLSVQVGGSGAPDSTRSFSCAELDREAQAKATTVPIDSD